MQIFYFNNDFNGKKFLSRLMNLKGRKFLFILSIFLCGNIFAGNLFSDSTKQPTAITLTITTVNSTCQKSNGKVIVQATGGVAPYNFTLVGGFVSNGSTNGIFYKIVGGTYTLTVTDAIGTQVIQTVVLGNLFQSPIIPFFVGTTGASPISCAGNEGLLTIFPTGGVPPYTYSIDNINFQNSNTFTNLYAGDYYPIAKDINGCNSISEIFLPILIQIRPTNCTTIAYNGPSITSSCNPHTESPSFPIPNGFPPYTYSSDGVNYQTNASFPPFPTGLHTFYIKDAVGTILAHTLSVIDFYCTNSFLLSTTAQPATCGVNGSITVTATEGTAPYEYSLDGINFQTANQFTGLANAAYTVTVRDFYGMESDKYVIVPNNCLQVIPTTSSSTCGNSNGKIIAQASNGVAPYEYSLNGGAYSSSNVFNNLAANNYVVRAKDATNRVAIANTIVSNIAGAQIMAADTTATGCSNNTGAITVQAQAGTLPYLYSIDGTNFQNTGLFTGLAQNNYTVTVKDARGCLTTKPALITVNNNLFVDAGDTVTICEGKIGATNAVSDAATFSWLPAVGLNNANTLNPMANPTQTTTYFLTGTKGVCTKTDSVLVLVKPVPIANAGLGATICFGQNAMLQAAAGQAIYTWQPTTYLSSANNAISDVIKPKNNITYALSVVGANGCTSLQDGQVTIKVTPPPKVFVGNDTSIAIGEPLILQAIDVNGSGFNQFAWQPFYLLNDAAAQYPIIQNIQSNTMFSVTATTVAGCVGVDSVNIKVFNKPDIYVPNAFSPNADGNNDVLRAIPVGIKLFKFFTVYDRYGHQIFNTTDPNKGWDGKTNGSLNNTGSFIWITAGVDYTGRVVERKGAVVLVR
jgi:gliding motility-associated-like protein